MQSAIAFPGVNTFAQIMLARESIPPRRGEGGLLDLRKAEMISSK